MATEEVKGTKFICDAPKCNKSQVVPDGDDHDALPPKGWFKGTIRRYDDVGGDWLACTDAHIRMAALSVFARPNDG